MALAQTPAREGEHSEPRPPPSPRQHANSVEPHHVATLGVPDTINPGTGAGPGPAEPIVARDVFGVTSPSATGNLVDSGNAGFQVVMPQLARLGDALENMNRVLVGTQNSMARVECSVTVLRFRSMHQFELSPKLDCNGFWRSILGYPIFPSSYLCAH